MNTNHGKAVDALSLSNLWIISPDRDKNKVWKKTQRGIRAVMNPQMSRWYPTNELMLRYPRLPHPLFTDTMIDGTVSKRGKNNAQVYCTYFGWTSFYPMKLKSDSHEKFPLLFKSDGVPPETIMDNSKNQLSSNFVRSCVSLTSIRRQSNPTYIVSQPLRGTSVN